MILATLFPPLLLGFCVSLGFAALSRWWYLRRGWLDDPRTSNHPKHTHQQPVPRGGGVAVVAGIVIACVLWIPLTTQVEGWILALLMLLLVGLIDDVKDLDPRLRLLVGGLVALILIVSGTAITYLTHPYLSGELLLIANWLRVSVAGLELSLVSIVLSLIWVVGMMNSINWSKGIDGQLPGFVTIALIFLGYLSMTSQADQAPPGMVSFILISAGAFLALWVTNLYPQIQMPGYAGGAGAGLILAIIGIASGAKLAALLFILAIPLTDAGFTVIRRVSTGKSPLWGDRGHLHHRLLDLGIPLPWVSAIYWIGTLVLGAVGLWLESSSMLFVLVGLVAVLLWLLVLLWRRNERDRV